MVYCSNCGTHGEGRFCYACGSKLHEEVAVATTAPSPAAVPASVALPVARAPWRDDTKRAWTWWLRGFVWIAAIVSIELIVMISSMPDAESRTPAETVAAWIGAFLGLGLVLAIQYGLARWLLGSFERGSGLARRVFQIGFVGLAAIRTFFGVLMLAGGLIPLLDTLAGIGQLAAWGYAAWLLQRVDHPHTPYRVVREDGTVVRMRTEIPSFVATVAILLLGVVQLGADLVRNH